MIEVVKKNTVPAMINLVSSIIFLSLSIVFLMGDTPEMCMASGIFLVLGMVTALLGKYFTNPTKIRISEGYLTIHDLGNFGKLRRYRMKDVERVDIHRRKGRPFVVIKVRGEREFIINSSGMKEDDMETLVSALKELGEMHGFPVNDNSVETQVYRDGEREKAPYKVK